jgi:L-arabinose isomerase
MIDLKQYEVWFLTGSQHLYGPKTLETDAEHSREIAAAWGASALIRAARWIRNPGTKNEIH